MLQDTVGPRAETGGGNGKLAPGSRLGKPVGRGGIGGPEDAGPGSYPGRPGRVTPRLRYRPRRESRSPHIGRRGRTRVSVGLEEGPGRSHKVPGSYPGRWPFAAAWYRLWSGSPGPPSAACLRCKLRSHDRVVRGAARHRCFRACHPTLGVSHSQASVVWCSDGSMRMGRL